MSHHLAHFLRARFGILDKQIYILSLGWLVSSAGFAMTIPFLSLYFHQELKMSMTAIGLFFGVTAVLRAAPQPLAGWLSDRVGRVLIMGWSQILRAGTFAGVGYAMRSASGFWPIAAAIAFNYIFGAALQPAAHAMVADLAGERERISAFSMLRIAGNLSWAIGPALGGFLAHQSYSTLFYASGVLNLISGIYFLVVLRESPHSTQAISPGFRFKELFNLRQDKLLFRHCLISFLLFLVVAQLIAALSVYCVDTVGIGQAQLGVLYAINGFMVVVFQLPMMALFKRLTLTHQLAAGAAVYAVGYFLVGIAGGFAFLVICMVVITVAEMMVSPPSLTLVANLSSPSTYGRDMGLFGFFHMSGWSLGPTVGGFMLDLFSARPILTWAVIALMALAASALYINFGRRLSRAINSGLVVQEEDPSHA